MAYSIKDPETDRLTRQLAKATGESLTAAVSTAVKERLDRLQGRRPQSLHERVEPIIRAIAAIPVLDPRPMDELLGYDEDGLPH